MKTLKERLEFVQNGRTQKEFAEIIGIPLNTYTAWLRDERLPSYDAIQKLCSVLGVTADWILTGRAGVTPAQMKESAETGRPITEYECENEIALLKHIQAFIAGVASAPAAPPREPPPDAYAIRTSPCPSCARLEREVEFLRSALASALDRIPKA
jgi:transcriptional regulator with XRE-family HTH domain